MSDGVETGEGTGRFPITCPDCGTTFHTKQELHEKSVSMTETLYYCPECLVLGRFRFNAEPLASNIA